MSIKGILITIALSNSLIFETNGLKNYVTPNETAQCSNDWSNCLILEEYASQPDSYFKNNTIFQFEPGSHQLNRSLNFTNLHNFTLLGKRSEVIIILLGPLVRIKWENCSNIEISSISIILFKEFTFSIIFGHSNLVHLCNISVHGNEENIGCSSILSRYSTLHIQDSTFEGIRGSFGAAMMISRSCVTFTGKNIFINNSARYGGSIYTTDSVITLSGINTFMNNTSPKDFFHIDSQCQQDIEHNWFRRSGGGAIYCSSSTLNINSEYSLFANNFAQDSGGAIHAKDVGNITITGSVTFMKNIAKYGGGALFVASVTLILNGKISFIDNKAGIGGALSISGAKFLIVGEERMANEILSIFNDAAKFCRNVAMNGDAANIEAEHVRVLDTCNGHFNESGITKGVAVFRGNIAFSEGGGMKSDDGSDIIIFDGSIHFENNTAVNGGGMYLSDNSKLTLSSFTQNVSFILNHAWSLGGALYIDDSQCSTLPIAKDTECFLSFYGDKFYTITKYLLLFLNNSAGYKGSILYGGQINKCRLRLIANVRLDDHECGNSVADYRYRSGGLAVFMNVSRISESESTSSITSNTEQMKFCQLEGEKIALNDHTLLLYLNAYPGEEFNISLTTLDQIGSPVPTTVFIEKKYIYIPGDQYHLSPSRQSTNGHFCTNMTYKLYSAHEHINVYFKLYHANPCRNLADGLSLNMFIKPCPFGFELAANQQCDCNKRLLKFTHKCSIDKSTTTIKRETNSFWISQTDLNVILIHEFHCPLDYCKVIPENVSLSDPSVQCDFNRTGIVCGRCQKNFSLALGSLHCTPCNNKYIALILFFMMAGVALIAFIFLFRVTVPVGTLSGLFFYANIIQANHQAYFPRATMNFFTTFISWLNLDLGIETCFYDGMDIYAYSWFQFLFPFYVWFLVGCIIMACRYSQSIAKRLGKNPVAVLATLLLMSYSKIIGAVIVPLTWTYLSIFSGV